MSLTRISSYGSLSPDRGRSPSGSPPPRQRKLSFNPLPGDWDPPTDVAQEAHAQPISAFEVPKSRRIRESYPC